MSVPIDKKCARIDMWVIGGERLLVNSHSSAALIWPQCKENEPPIAISRKGLTISHKYTAYFG